MGIALLYIGRTSIVILTLLSVALPLWGFIWSLSTSGPNDASTAVWPPREPGQLIPLDRELLIAPNGAHYLGPTRADIPSLPLMAIVQFSSLRLADGILEIQVTIEVQNEDSLVNIIDRKSKDSVFSKQNGTLVLNDRHRDSEVALLVNSRLVGGGATSIPLQRLALQPAHPLTVRISSTFQLGLGPTGPNRYPADWYRATASAYVQLPPHLLWKSNGRTEDSIPTSMALSSWQGPTDKILYFESDPDAMALPPQDQAGSAPSAELLIERPLSAQVFVWTMALTPMLLLIVMIMQVAGIRRRERTASASGGYVSLELAAAMLAILSLRQVLVPAEIQGFTTIDFLLGAQLAAFIALVVLEYVLFSRDTNSRKT